MLSIHIINTVAHCSNEDLQRWLDNLIENRDNAQFIRTFSKAKWSSQEEYKQYLDELSDYIEEELKRRTVIGI